MSRRNISLTRYLVEQQRTRGHIPGQLRLLIEVVARACKRISHSVNKGALGDVLGSAGTGNVQVKLTVNSDGSGFLGTLMMGSTANLTVLGNNTGDVTITGQIVDINAGLSGLKFTPRSNYNGSAMITMVTNDLGNTGPVASTPDTDVIHINVAAVNDAPTMPARLNVSEAPV